VLCAAAPTERLVAFTLTERGVARPGDPVIGGGEVTSGTFSPTLEIAIGMAYLPSAKADVGEAFDIDVRGKVRHARVAARPLYTPS
jgi:aminomethyltransferase